MSEAELRRWLRYADLEYLEVTIRVDRRSRSTPDYVKRLRRFPFNFELRGDGGEADVMMLYKFRRYLADRKVGADSPSRAQDYAILYYTILYYTILYYTILYCTIVYHYHNTCMYVYIYIYICIYIYIHTYVL